MTCDMEDCQETNGTNGLLHISGQAVSGIKQGQITPPTTPPEIDPFAWFKLGWRHSRATSRGVVAPRWRNQGTLERNKPIGISFTSFAFSFSTLHASFQPYREFRAYNRSETFIEHQHISFLFPKPSPFPTYGTDTYGLFQDEEQKQNSANLIFRWFGTTFAFDIRGKEGSWGPAELHTHLLYL